YDRTNILDLHIILYIPINEIPQTSDFGSDQGRCFFTKMVNAQTGQDPLERIGPGFFDAGPEVLNGLLPKSFQRFYLIKIEIVNMAYVAQPAFLEKRLYQSFTQSIYIHSILGYMIYDPLQDLGITIDIGTPPGCFRFLPYERSTTHGTINREFDFLLGSIAELRKGFHYIRYDVTSSFDQHLISQTNILASDKILIVKRDRRNRHPCQLGRSYL